MDGPDAAGQNRPDARRDAWIVRAIEWLLLLSRWLMVPLLFALLAFPAYISYWLWLDVVKIAENWDSIDRVNLILKALHSVDLVLVAALVLTVALSIYEETVSRLDVGDERPAWLGKLDSSGLKLKVALSILAIATIELLTSAFEIDKVSNRVLSWGLAIYAMFLLGTMVIVVALRLSSKSH